jgi:glutamyl-tRNA synthetase
MPELGPPRGIGSRIEEPLRGKLLAAMPGLKERAKTLVELLDSAYYLYAKRPLALDDKARALLEGGGRERLAGMAQRLEAVPEWAPPALEAAVRAHADALGVKLGQAAQPLRAALTGRATSPGLFDVMAVLGKQETLARLRDQDRATAAG